MLCPFCKEKDTSVVDSRPTEDGTAIRRRRVCLCGGGQRFTTFERVQFRELTVIKKNCTTKFDESLDLSFQINNKQKKSEVNIRTVVNLPAGTGKKVKVAVVCEDRKAEEAYSSLYRALI